MATTPESAYGIKRTKVNINIHSAAKQIQESIKNLILETNKDYTDITILCIGTDKDIGDSFGPICGHLLSKQLCCSDCNIVGTLEKPVHAKNLEDTLKTIDQENTLVIAIDACLGMEEDIETIVITNDKISPGKGVGKELSKVGDVSIKGITCEKSDMSLFGLENTRLGMVFKMAEITAKALSSAIKDISLSIIRLNENAV